MQDRMPAASRRTHPAFTAQAVPADKPAKPGAFTLALMVLAWGSQVFAADCAGWNTKPFSEVATPSQLSACLATGADPMARNMIGETPLHMAVMHSDDPALVSLLVKNGADPNARAEEGTTPLHAAVDLNHNPAVITALVEAGADPNARDEYGWAPLHQAVVNRSGSVVIATALILAGADPDARGKYGETPCTRWPGTSMNLPP